MATLTNIFRVLFLLCLYFSPQKAPPEVHTFHCSTELTELRKRDQFLTSFEAMHPKQHCKLGLNCQICIANKDAQAHADFQNQVLSGKKHSLYTQISFFMSL